MSNPYGLNKYKQTSVTTASRGQVLLMLYEGAIKNCKMAIEGLEQKNLAKKGEYILKVQDIVNELSLSLNHEVGGDIAKELERLYMFIIDQLTEANLKNQTQPMKNVVKILETLHEGWVEAVKQVGKFGGDPNAAAASEIESGQISTESLNAQNALKATNAAKSATSSGTLPKPAAVNETSRQGITTGTSVNKPGGIKK